MPIYEYRCSSCGHEFEALQKFSDARLSTCPSCHAEALVKKISAAGFQLKGSGWYATDFKGSGAKPAPAKTDGAAAADASGTSDATAKTEAKGDAAALPKPESKSDAASPSAAPAAKAGFAPAAT